MQKNFFVLPHEAPGSDLHILIVLYALAFAHFMSSANVSLGSKVRTIISEKGFVASMLSS